MTRVKVHENSKEKKKLICTSNIYNYKQGNINVGKPTESNYNLFCVKYDILASFYAKLVTYRWSRYKLTNQNRLNPF